jgi:predicted metalloprotease with PDZ domain
VGLLTPAQAWEQIDAGFGRGRSATRAGDDMLERVAAAYGERPNFMRIYWSGTAFWLESDVELRRSSGGRLGVDEALRRFDACCLPDYRGWSPEDFVAKLDALIGSDVFRKHFDAYRARRDFPDLDPLYRALGLRHDGKAISFDEAAPDAGVRRAIMAAPAPTPAR